MTMIDACTSLVEIKRTLRTTAAEGAAAVKNNWLARYPKPTKIVTDQGPEFSTEFSSMCNKNEIKHSTSTSRNPQGNYLIKRIHQNQPRLLRIKVQNSVRSSPACATRMESNILHQHQENPQRNSLIERIHQTIGQVLRTVTAAKDPKTLIQEELVIEEKLATAKHACRSV